MSERSLCPQILIKIKVTQTLHCQICSVLIARHTVAHHKYPAMAYEYTIQYNLFELK